MSGTRMAQNGPEVNTFSSCSTARTIPPKKTRAEYATEDMARGDQITCAICTEVGFPVRSSEFGFLIAMLGISGGRLRFAGPHRVVYRHLFKADDSVLTDEQVKDKLKAARKKFLRLQTRLGLSWLSYEPGAPGRKPTMYDMPFIEYRSQAHALYQKLIADKDPDCLTANGTPHPGKAAEKAARIVANQMPRKTGDSPSVKGESQKGTTPLKRLQTFDRNIQRLIADYTELGYTEDQIRFQITGAFESLLKKHLPEQEGNPTRRDSTEAKGCESPPYAKRGSNPTPILLNDTGGDGIDFALPADPDPFLEADSQTDALTVRQGIEMVEAFESVGARSFDVTLTNERRQSQDFIAGVDAGYLKHILPDLLARTEQIKLNLIIRPRAGAVQLVQLDDLVLDTVERLAGYAFLVIETSPGNYQAWLAVDSQDQNIKQRLSKKIKFDTGANGAVRVVGSLNVKPQHRQPDGSYHRVRLVDVEPGLLVELGELERAGLLGNREKPPCVVSAASQREHYRESTTLPDYDLGGAPTSREGKPDRSSYDIRWAMRAIRQGCDPGDVVSGLQANSPKAGSRKDRYAQRTVAKATQYLGL